MFMYIYTFLIIGDKFKILEHFKEEDLDCFL